MLGFSLMTGTSFATLLASSHPFLLLVSNLQSLCYALMATLISHQWCPILQIDTCANCAILSTYSYWNNLTLL